MEWTYAIVTGLQHGEIENEEEKNNVKSSNEKQNRIRSGKRK